MNILVIFKIIIFLFCLLIFDLIIHYILLHRVALGRNDIIVIIFTYEVELKFIFI